MQNSPENGLSFISHFYPEKKWRYREINKDILFFDTTDLGEEDEENYEQAYIIHKENGWEVIHDLDTGYSSPYKPPYDLSNDVENFNKENNTVGVPNSIGIDQYTYRYFGSKSSIYLEEFAQDKIKHFLQIVKDGLDCSLPKGARSTFDLSHDIDFDKLVLDCHIAQENLLWNYFSYIDHRLCVFLDYIEESFIYDSIVTTNSDDSLTDMLFVLDKIKKANNKAGYQLILSSSFVSNIANNIEDIQSNINFDDSFTKRQKKEVDKTLKKLLKEINSFQ